MAEIIAADQLKVGDIYRNVRGTLYPEVSGDAFEVIGVRTVRTVETYQVVEAHRVTAVEGRASQLGLRAEINLRSDVLVARLEEQHLRDLKGYLDYMGEGEAITIVRANGRFWV